MKSLIYKSVVLLLFLGTISACDDFGDMNIDPNEPTEVPAEGLVTHAMYTSEEDKLEGLGVGADAYLTKPFNVEELKIRIKNLIKERKKLWQHYHEELSYQPQKLNVSSPDQKFLRQALEVLEEHKSDPEFNSAKLQQELGVSRTLLHVKLKALTGQSTTEFIRIYRLKYAATLILQDFGNIAEITYESGFNDQSYFTKSFRKHFGVAPSEYKRTR